MEWKYIVEAIIGVIILVIFVPLMLGSAKDVIALIQEKLGILRYSSIEKAVLCSYYRCVEGCGSPEVSTETGGFCTDEQYIEGCSIPGTLGLLPSDKRVCGWLAAQFPIEVSSKDEKELEIDKNKLKKYIDDLKCIFTGNPPLHGKNSISIWDSISSSHIDPEEKCNKYNGVLDAKLKKGPYYVYSLSKPSTFIKPSREYIFINVGSNQGGGAEFTIYTLGNLEDIERPRFYRVVLNSTYGRNDIITFLPYAGKDNGKQWAIVKLTYYNTSDELTTTYRLLVVNENDTYCELIDRRIIEGKWLGYFCVKLTSADRDKATLMVFTIPNLNFVPGYDKRIPIEVRYPCKDVPWLEGKLECKSECSYSEDKDYEASEWCKAIYGEESPECCYLSMSGAP